MSKQLQPAALHLTARVGVHQVADYLRAHGVEVLSVMVSDEPTVEDDDIDLGDDLSIQVGRGYAVVNRWNERQQCVYSSKTRHNAALLLTDIALARLAASLNA